MDKKNKKVSRLISRFRGLIQGCATLATNIHLPNFFKGGIYQGKGKAVCVPGLNCYSCPGCVRCLPYRLISGGSGLIKIRLFILYNRISDFDRCVAGPFCLRFFMSIRSVAGFCYIKFPAKSFQQKKLKPL